MKKQLQRRTQIDLPEQIVIKETRYEEGEPEDVNIRPGWCKIQSEVLNVRCLERRTSKV